MINADELVKQLNIENVEGILRKLGAQDIIIKDEQIITNTICHNHSGGSHKLYYLNDTKRFHCFTSCGSMSIYDLIMSRLSMQGIGCNFQDSISWLMRELGLMFNTNVTLGNQFKENEELNWMNKFKRDKTAVPELPAYSDLILELFTHHGGHSAFTADNISYEAMDRFNIRYSWSDNALIIPHRKHDNGKIIGLMNRNLSASQVAAGYKYIPTTVSNKNFSFPKHLNLYGFWENKDAITTQRKVAIFESEKSVLQCESYFGQENNFAVALGGKNLSDEHINILIKSGINEVILNFDKDFDDPKSREAELVKQHIMQTARKLTPYMRVYTTWDSKGLLDKHDSPSDKGVGILMQLLNDKEEIYNVTV